MRTGAIIQARMGSLRLPGKILAEVNGTPLLSLMINRLKFCEKLDEIIVASPIRDDAVIHPVVRAAGARMFYGPEEDVLTRVLRAATEWKIDTIVELTADCPLIDPGVVSDTILMFEKHRGIGVDFVSTSRDVVGDEWAYPRGMDVRVFSRETLEIVDSLTNDPRDREHVSIYIWEHPKLFGVLDVLAPKDLRDDVRLTVDYPEDLALVRHLFGALGVNPSFSLKEILNYLNENPELRQVNAHVQQKSAR